MSAFEGIHRVGKNVEKAFVYARYTELLYESVCVRVGTLG